MKLFPFSQHFCSFAEMKEIAMIKVHVLLSSSTPLLWLFLLDSLRTGFTRMGCIGLLHLDILMAVSWLQQVVIVYSFM